MRVVKHGKWGTTTAARSFAGVQNLKVSEPLKSFKTGLPEELALTVPALSRS